MADGRAPSGQALAVPATPASAVDGPAGFDPSRGGRFRKRPVEVEAFQWTNQDRNDWPQWAGDDDRLEDVFGLLIGISVVGLKVWTLNGPVKVNHGEWIVKGVKGELYPCDPEIFAETYDAIATEARRAGTGNTDPVHEGAGRDSGIAQPPSGDISND